MPFRLRPALAALLAAGGLAACTSLPPGSASPLATRHYAESFALEGRIAASDGQQAANGLLSWQHTPDSDALTLSTPLGQIAAELLATTAEARLRTADGRVFVAESSEALLPHLFGIEVPVRHLGRWAQGAPAPGARIREHDAQGRPTVMFDQGWRIDYLAYADPAATALPARLELSRGEARIRLVIDSWTLSP